MTKRNTIYIGKRKGTAAADGLPAGCKKLQKKYDKQAFYAIIDALNGGLVEDQ